MTEMPRLRTVALTAVTLLLAACGRGDQENADAEGDSATVLLPITVSGIGLETPESVLYDEIADLYLVSNIAGDPAGVDDNGFITRIHPDGAVETLRWIDGAAANVTLNAPKGMAFRGDTLFVADIDTLRAFHRTSGQPLGATGIPGATFLNDVAAAPNGVYVTDTGLGADGALTGTAAIYVVGSPGVAQIARGDVLGRPNGVSIGGGEVYTVGSGSALLRMPAGGGEPSTVVELPAGQLDGVVWLNTGEFLVSSWESSTVYHVRPGGSVQTIVEHVRSPADIGWDSRRRRVLIPILTENRIEIHEVP